MDLLERERESDGLGVILGVNCGVPLCGEVSLFIGKSPTNWECMVSFFLKQPIGGSSKGLFFNQG